MKNVRRMLLACALAPVVWQVPARADAARMQLAQDTPACTPGDPACPPKPEVQPAPAAPKPEVQPAPVEPKPEVQPAPVEPKPEVQPAPVEPKPEVQPAPVEPKPEVQPAPVEPKPEVQPAPSEPKPEAAPAKPEVQPAPAAPKPEVQPAPAAPKPEVQPAPSEPKPEAAPAKPEATPAEPKPEVQPAPAAPRPTPQPTPDAPRPTPQPTPDSPPSPPAQPAPDAGFLSPIAPPAQPETSQTPPPAALIEKLSDPGAATAAAVGESLDRKAGNLRDVQRGRQIISNDNGVQVTVEPGGRVIVQSGDQAVIRHDDRGRFETEHRNLRERPTGDGGRELIFDGRDGGRVRTYYDESGVVIRREREDPQGHVFVLFGNRFGDGSDGYDTGGWQPVVQLPPPPVYDVPRNRYRVETRSAPPGYVAEALSAPPLVDVKPAYTLDQVIYSPDLRDRVRSVDLDSISFQTGRWMVDSSEVRSIESVARGISDALRRNPNEVFLVEGYTDAVGSVVDNLSLSDRRAESVARVLTDVYRIPPENLVTQGYGESYLKVPTEGPERANRRVTVRRITPLLATSQN